MRAGDVVAEQKRPRRHGADPPSDSRESRVEAIEKEKDSTAEEAGTDHCGADSEDEREAEEGVDQSRLREVFPAAELLEPF